MPAVMGQTVRVCGDGNEMLPC